MHIYTYTISIPYMFTSIYTYCRMIDISFFREAKRKASLAQVVSLIREVYKRRNPAKLGDVKDLVAKYKALGIPWPVILADVQRRWLKLKGVEDVEDFENLNSPSISLRNDIG